MGRHTATQIFFSTEEDVAGAETVLFKAGDFHAFVIVGNVASVQVTSDLEARLAVSGLSRHGTDSGQCSQSSYIEMGMGVACTTDIAVILS